MKIVTSIIFAMTLAVRLTPTVRAQKKPETPHLEFVTEYIRELAAIENIRESGEKELKENTDGRFGTFSNAINSSTLFQLELGSQIRMLKSMRLNPPYEDLISNITDFYAQKVTLWKRLADVSTAFMSAPKPGVDYGKLGAEVPQIRGQLDYVDKALFEASVVVFATLIDQKPDSKNHVSHLIITSTERAKLIDDINTDFGSKLDQKAQNWTVSAASVLKGYLLKDFKSSDDPWE